MNLSVNRIAFERKLDSQKPSNESRIDALEKDRKKSDLKIKNLEETIRRQNELNYKLVNYIDEVNGNPEFHKTYDAALEQAKSVERGMFHSWCV